MMPAEFNVIGLNLVMMLLSYFWIYPKYCGADIKKIINNDLIATALVLIVVGTVYWGSGVEFSLLLFSVNWFWFTLTTYLLLEVPFMLWYFNKYDVWSNFDN